MLPAHQLQGELVIPVHTYMQSCPHTHAPGGANIRQKLVRRLLEEQDKVLRSYFAQKGGTRGQRGGGTHGQGRKHVKWDMYV